jgi:hypothetical protein
MALTLFQMRSQRCVSLWEDECSEPLLSAPSIFKRESSYNLPTKKEPKRLQPIASGEEPNRPRSILSRSRSDLGQALRGRRPLPTLTRSMSYSRPKSVQLAHHVVVHKGALTTTEKMKLPPRPTVNVETLDMFKSLSSRSSSIRSSSRLPPRLSSASPTRTSPSTPRQQDSDGSSRSSSSQMRTRPSAPQQKDYNGIAYSSSLMSKRPSIHRQKGSRGLFANAPSIAEIYHGISPTKSCTDSSSLSSSLPTKRRSSTPRQEEYYGSSLSSSLPTKRRSSTPRQEEYYGSSLSSSLPTKRRSSTPRQKDSDDSSSSSSLTRRTVPSTDSDHSNLSSSLSTMTRPSIHRQEGSRNLFYRSPTKTRPSNLRQQDSDGSTSCSSSSPTRTRPSTTPRQKDDDGIVYSTSLIRKRPSIHRQRRSRDLGLPKRKNPVSTAA